MRQRCERLQHSAAAGDECVALVLRLRWRVLIALTITPSALVAAALYTEWLGLRVMHSETLDESIAHLGYTMDATATSACNATARCLSCELTRSHAVITMRQASELQDQPLQHFTPQAIFLRVSCSYARGGSFVPSRSRTRR